MEKVVSIDIRPGGIPHVRKLVAAIGTLTQNVLSLTTTVHTIDAGLRQRLALDAAEDAPQALDHKPEGAGGTEALPASKRGKGKVA